MSETFGAVTWGCDMKGYTLIELAIAILVFAMGIIGIAQMQSKSVQANSYSLQLTDSVNLAQNQIEKLRGYDLSAIISSTNAPYVTSTGIAYTVSWTTEGLSLNPDTMRITVTTSWMEKDEPHTVSLSFVKGEE